MHVLNRFPMLVLDSDADWQVHDRALASAVLSNGIESKVKTTCTRHAQRFQKAV